MDNNLLDYGVTGFWMVDQDEPPKVARTDVTAAMRAVALSVGWQVLETRWAEHTSFHETRMAGDDQRLSILFNISYPLVAFSEPTKTGDMHIDFKDHQPLAQAVLHATKFRPLAIAELMRPLQQADLSGLNEAEHQQIDYWQPATIGEVIFNFWD